MVYLWQPVQNIARLLSPDTNLIFAVGVPRGGYSEAGRLQAWEHSRKPHLIMSLFDGAMAYPFIIYFAQNENNKARGQEPKMKTKQALFPVALIEVFGDHFALN